MSQISNLLEFEEITVGPMAKKAPGTFTKPEFRPEDILPAKFGPTDGSSCWTDPTWCLPTDSYSCPSEHQVCPSEAGC